MTWREDTPRARVVKPASLNLGPAPPSGYRRFHTVRCSPCGRIRRRAVLAGGTQGENRDRSAERPDSAGRDLGRCRCRARACGTTALGEPAGSRRTGGSRRAAWWCPDAGGAAPRAAAAPRPTADGPTADGPTAPQPTAGARRDGSVPPSRWHPTGIRRGPGTVRSPEAVPLPGQPARRRARPGRRVGRERVLAPAGSTRPGSQPVDRTGCRPVADRGRAPRGTSTGDGSFPGAGCGCRGGLWRWRRLQVVVCRDPRGRPRRAHRLRCRGARLEPSEPDAQADADGLPEPGGTQSNTQSNPVAADGVRAPDLEDRGAAAADHGGPGEPRRGHPGA